MNKLLVLLSIICIVFGAKKTRYNPRKLKNLSLGNAMTHTLTKLDKLPITSQAAQGMGWKPAFNGECIPGLGVLYLNDGKSDSNHPLSAYYTFYGQLAGLQMAIFGSQDGTVWSKGVGDAAQKNLVDQGFWKANGDKKWVMSVSFRPPEDVCSTKKLSEPIGDRLVINQMKGGIARPIPLTAAEAQANGFQAGSCMAQMGQHWEYDLATAPKMSWTAGNLLPVVPMYHTTGPNIGNINAFFFTSPVCQDKSSGDWDVVPAICGLSASLMCKNWCNNDCKWNTSWWATQHVFFNANPKDVKCANPISYLKDPILAAAGGECPQNTPNPQTKRWFGK